MKRIQQIIILTGAGILLSGCSIKGSIEDLTAGSKTVVSGNQAGLSSGATAIEVVNGYTVSTSLGSYSDGIQETKNGYRVYLSLQGSTTSEVTIE